MDGLIAHVVASTGWSIESVEAKTLPELKPLLEYWNENPPLHLLIKAFMGFEGKGERLDDGDSPEADQYLNRVSSEEFDEILRAHGLPVE